MATLAENPGISKWLEGGNSDRHTICCSWGAEPKRRGLQAVFPSNGWQVDTLKTQSPGLRQRRGTKGIGADPERQDPNDAGPSINFYQRTTSSFGGLRAGG